MKVNVKLYGTLSAGVAGYDHTHGLDLDLNEGMTIEDLMVKLGIASSKRPVAAIDGRIQKNDRRISAGAHIQVFQPVHGG